MGVHPARTVPESGAGGSTRRVIIFAARSNGNVAPVATIGGPDTFLNAPGSIALHTGGNVYVGNQGGTVVNPGASNANLVNSHQFTFTEPAGAKAGAS